MTEFSFSGEVTSPVEPYGVPEVLIGQDGQEILLAERGSVVVFIVREPGPAGADTSREITPRDSEITKSRLVKITPEDALSEEEIAPSPDLLDYLEEAA